MDRNTNKTPDQPAQRICQRQYRKLPAFQSGALVPPILYPPDIGIQPQARPTDQVARASLSLSEHMGATTNGQSLTGNIGTRIRSHKDGNALEVVCFAKATQGVCSVTRCAASGLSHNAFAKSVRIRPGQSALMPLGPTPLPVSTRRCLPSSKYCKSREYPTDQTLRHWR